MAQERVHVAAVVRVEGDADRCLDPEREVLQHDRLLERRADLVEGGDHVGRLLLALEQDAELVATEPRDGVGLTEDALQPASELHQEQVARVVAE